MPAANAKSKATIKMSDVRRLIGLPSAIGPINDYETNISTKLLKNADSWLGLNNSHIKTLKNFQDDFIIKLFQVAAMRMPKSMLWLDGQILQIKRRIIKLKLKARANTMGKSKENLFRQALTA